MEIAKIIVNATTGCCRLLERIPARIVGATVTVEFRDPVWDKLTKTVVFRGAKAKIAEFDGKVAVVPWEVVQEPGQMVCFGIWGRDPESDFQLPLIEVMVGIVEDATDPNADPETDPSKPVWAKIADDVVKLADEVAELKQTGGGGTGKPGADGEDGGYYTPAVTQLDEDTIQFAFTGSKPDMPAVEPVDVKLPVSENSGGNVELDTTLTQSGKAADAKAVGDAIKNLQLSGGGSLNIRDMEVNEIFTITGTDSGGSGDTDEPGEDEPSTGAVAINGRIIDIDMRNVQATDEYLTDTSGNGNHMKLSAVGSASKDNVWTPIYYDTTANINKYVGAYTENTIDFTGDFTVEVFCEVTGNTNNRFFITGAPGWSGTDYMFEIKARNNNGVAIPIYVGFTDQKKGYYPKIEDLSEIFLPGNFYHITVARTGNDVSLYKNGEIVRTLTLTNEIPLNYRFYLSGNIESDGTVDATNGPVNYKMLRAYTRALSASEIANHYNIELAKG